MKKLLSYLLKLGIHPDNNFGFNQRLKNYNLFIITCWLLSFAYLLFMVFNGFYQFALFFLLINGFLSGSFVLHHYRKYAASRVVILFTTCIGVLLLGIFFGPHSGFRMYYFIAPLIVFSVFKYNQWKQVTFALMLYSASFIYLQYLSLTQYTPFYPASTNFLHLLFNINAFITFVFGTVLTASISRFYLSFAHSLKKKNLKLELFQTELQQIVTEKNVLLAETHHRVKNNLAMISGIFDLQLMIEKNKTNKELLIKSKHRIKSMSLVHELLYQNNNLAEIELDSYMQKLVSTLEEIIPSDKTIRFHMDLAPLRLDLSRAISLGLIINEVVTNAVKHAFNQQQEGSITLELKQVDSDYTLRIQDNGSGFSPDEVPAESSIGHELIEALSAQLEAQSAFQQKEGTCFTLIFPAHG